MERQPYQIISGVWMVPCTIDDSKTHYSPACKPFPEIKIKGASDTRKSWTNQEDDFLKEIIEIHGSRNWSAIAVDLNMRAHKGLPFRKGKQCRERWLGHLRPNIAKRDWSNQEDFALVVKQAAIGNRWTEISNFFPGRTENQIKNRWRRLSKINKVLWKKNSEPFAFLPTEFMVQQVESYNFSFSSLFENNQ